MRFTEEELRQAARRVQAKQLAQLPPKETCTDRFSPAYQDKMQELIAQVKAGKVPQTVAPMGWQHYAHRGVAAALLGFLLACVTMPQAVLAGYQRVLDVVETIFQEYTEFRYTANTSTNTGFIPLYFHDLPDGMQEVKRREHENSVSALYTDSTGERYLDISQKLLTEDGRTTYIVDTEDAEQETVYIGAEEVTFIFKENRISFIWLHECTLVTGQTNLTRAELLQILQQTTYI